MANTTNLNVRVDENLKHKAETIFNELGMSLSTAMNMFLRSAVRYGGIPFELKLSQKPKSLTEMSEAELNMKLEAGLASMKEGRGRPASKVFDDLEKELELGTI